jgi:hypothetical protein
MSGEFAGTASINPVYQLNGENYFFPLPKWSKFVNISSSNDYFISYKNCIGYVLQQILAAI